MESGTFSEKSLLEFSEKIEELLDFTRCVRADGSAYGTSGQCRKGTAEAKEAKASTPPKPKAKAKRVKAGTDPEKAVKSDAKVKKLSAEWESARSERIAAGKAYAAARKNIREVGKPAVTEARDAYEMAKDREARAADKAMERIEKVRRMAEGRKPNS
ncbi:hypothetical protein SCBWM1_gp165 [Synechococcus phage S-CBWM1]|uniref:Uncharacterized protein n=1 Tax=Synechococcus phage S-CBWM1 TaxID=2053653 RepID=A0A3G1L3U0_9CAUD|nr:hypothetical protein HOU61_gp032 [Synechococcus phage S-CBWM1]ATW62849.1 hypothetical protein SCBWM1_gp165 [Synechococcus phage S-CBWM1]